MTQPADIRSTWRIDPDGYIISPSGSKVARLQNDTLMLYDKKLRVALPFLMSDWASLRMQVATINSQKDDT